MKRLGIPEQEGLCPDDQFLHYFGLFKGPLTDETVKALMALCGLEYAPTASAAQV